MNKDGPFEAIPDFVPGNLLLIVQEALRNALHHAQPTSISVTIRRKAPGAPIYIELVDDGTDSDLGSQKGSEQGHFGIVGMMERAERLGGTLRVERRSGSQLRSARCEQSRSCRSGDFAGYDNTALHRRVIKRAFLFGRTHACLPATINPHPYPGGG